MTKASETLLLCDNLSRECGKLCAKTEGGVETTVAAAKEVLDKLLELPLSSEELRKSLESAFRPLIGLLSPNDVEAYDGCFEVLKLMATKDQLLERWLVDDLVRKFATAPKTIFFYLAMEVAQVNSSVRDEAIQLIDQIFGPPCDIKGIPYHFRADKPDSFKKFWKHHNTSLPGSFFHKKARLHEEVGGIMSFKASLMWTAQLDWRERFLSEVVVRPGPHRFQSTSSVRTN